MKATEVIERLNNLIGQYGDMDVIVRDYDGGNDFPMSNIAFEPSYEYDTPQQKEQVPAQFCIE